MTYGVKHEAKSLNQPISKMAEVEETNLNEWLDETEPMESVEEPKINRRKSVKPIKDKNGVIHVTTNARRDRLERAASAKTASSTDRKKLEKHVKKAMAEKKNKKDTKVIAKKRRFHPGTVALRQIKKYQKSVDFLIPKTRFNNLLNQLTEEIAENFKDKNGNIPNIRYTKKARTSLQTLIEDQLERIIDVTNIEALHRGVKGITPRDMKVAIAVMKRSEGVFTDYLPNASLEFLGQRQMDYVPLERS